MARSRVVGMRRYLGVLAYGAALVTMALHLAGLPSLRRSS